MERKRFLRPGFRGNLVFEAMTHTDNETIDTADLFAPAIRRQRLVEWQAPGPAAKAAAVLSGIETMRRIRDGILPPPPMAKLIGFRMCGSSRA